MAVLETIRNKFGILITVLIAIALLSFIVDPSSLPVFNSNQPKASGDDITVAEINGEKVSYYDFNNEMQLLNNGNSDRNSLRSQVMLKFIGEYLYSKNAQAAGFNVSDQEMAELLSGNISSNMVRMYLGEMTPTRLTELENNVGNDQSGRMKYWWNNVLSQVKSERYYTKYSQYLYASAFENPLVTEDNKTNANTLFDVEFILVPYEGLDEYENIEVTDEEVAKYYEAHKNLYKAPKSRSIDYILVEVDAENEEVADSVTTVFENIKNAEEFVKVAVDNEYLLGSLNYPVQPNAVLSDSDKLIAANENIFKWAYKDSKVGELSTIFYPKDEEKSYMAIAILNDANDTGYLKFENIASDIKRTIFIEKAKDVLLADVEKTISGYEDIKNISKILQYPVSSSNNVSFAKSDLDDRFVGAASVAKEDVVYGPIKGDNGIYIYKVTNRHTEEFYTDSDAKEDILESNGYYLMNYGYYIDPNIMYMMPNPGYINDYTYLYF